MSGNNLFEIPESRPSRLAELRQKYEAAENAYRDAVEEANDTGTRIPIEILRAMRSAQLDLLNEEAAELERKRRTP